MHHSNQISDLGYNGIDGNKVKEIEIDKIRKPKIEPDTTNYKIIDNIISFEFRNFFDEEENYYFFLQK